MRRRGFLSLLGAAALAPFVPVSVAELPIPAAWVPLTSFEGLLKEFYAEGTVKPLAYESIPSMLQKSERFT